MGARRPPETKTMILHPGPYDHLTAANRERLSAALLRDLDEAVCCSYPKRHIDALHLLATSIEHDDRATIELGATQAIEATQTRLELAYIPRETVYWG